MGCCQALTLTSHTYDTIKRRPQPVRVDPHSRSPLGSADGGAGAGRGGGTGGGGHPHSDAVAICYQVTVWVRHLFTAVRG